MSCKLLLINLFVYLHFEIFGCLRQENKFDPCTFILARNGNIMVGFWYIRVSSDFFLRIGNNMEKGLERKKEEKEIIQEEKL